MGPFQPGTMIDGFRLTEQLAAGGMAVLWRAEHPDHAMPLVLKIPFLDPGADVAVIVGYEVEEMILKRLLGPHVPRFIGSGDLAKIPYIAMEFIAGETIADRVEAAPLEADEVARIGIEVARALAAIHGQKVAHLDLKPENVKLTPRGAVLLDFGLARHAELPDLIGAERDLPIGSAAYIAPEQVLGIRSDPASDIFALGAILYQLATAEEPFGRPTSTAGMKRRLYHAPASPRAVNPAVPRWLEAVILKCLEVDRSRRYADAAKILLDLGNPEQVSIRPMPKPAQGLLASLGGFFRKREDRELIGPPAAALARLGPSIVLAAVDLADGSDPLAEAVLTETARLLATRPDSRLACVSVLAAEGIAPPPLADDEGHSLYVERLVALKHWARPLELPENRVGFHVLEAAGAADAILDFAARNEVGHIVMGARGSSALRRHLGSVSSRVVAEASCSVSVVRVKTAAE
jgi:nucleotide-binding universal stress UspA family protein